MKISQYIQVDERIRLKKIQLHRIKHNKCSHNLYLVCTTYKGDDLFEIVSGAHIGPKYENCYLLGIAKDKNKAIELVTAFVDQLYNQKTLTLQMLKQS
ncbi:MAG: hypothetical protein ACRCTE_09775 [Cellulosilyticaceae bacterium]